MLFSFVSIGFINFFVAIFHYISHSITICFENVTTTDLCNEMQVDKSINVCAAFNFLPPEIIDHFTAITGINVYIDSMPDEDLAIVKHCAGINVYDIVIITAGHLFHRYIAANVYRSMPYKTIIDMAHINPMILEKYSVVDPLLTHGVPFLYSFGGIAYNKNVLQYTTGMSEIANFKTLFHPAFLQLLGGYGIAMPESHNETFVLAALSTGDDIKTFNANNFQKSIAIMYNIMYSVKKFTYSALPDLLIGGVGCGICSMGDIMIANAEAMIGFNLPNEGTCMRIDAIAIPQNAQNVECAVIFMKYLTHPMVAAYITNKLYIANVIINANKYVYHHILANKNIYPDHAYLQKCYIDMIYVFGESLSRILSSIKLGVNE